MSRSDSTAALLSPSPVRRAVILAAGMGTRLGLGPESTSAVPKPLVPFGGRPIVLWILEALRRCGVTRVTLVVGWSGEILREFAAAQPVPGLALDTVDNDEWRKSNGVSLLKARDAVREPFLLLMSDHVFEDRLVAGLLAAPPVADGVVLAVDRRLAEIFDMDDATKVRTADDDRGRIIAIGKDLGDELAPGPGGYDAVDCGVFLCQPAVFDALEEARRAGGGDCSLSEGMRILAADGRFRAHDIGDAFWQDVDTPEMFAHAEKHLDRLRG